MINIKFLYVKGVYKYVHCTIFKMIVKQLANAYIYITFKECFTTDMHNDCMTSPSSPICFIIFFR